MFIKTVKICLLSVCVAAPLRNNSLTKIITRKKLLTP